MAVASESIGTLEVHPIDLISAYGTIANGGVLVPHRTILKVIGPDGTQVWPATDAKPTGKRVISREAAYIVTDILAGNTVLKTNPFWGKWQITDGTKVRPAAYKTGTTSDNRDVLAYGYLATPTKATVPALVAGVWMGNSDNTPNDGKLSLDTSAPLWSAILSEVSKGLPIEGFARLKPKTLQTATVDAFTGMKPGPGTTKTVSEMFIAGTAPTKSADVTVAVDIDQASRAAVAGRLRRPDGHPELPRPQPDRVELPGVAEGERRLAGARGEGPRRRRRAEADAHRLLLRQRVLSVRAVVGWQVPADETLPRRAAPAVVLHPARSVPPVPEPDAIPVQPECRSRRDRRRRRRHSAARLTRGDAAPVRA